MFTSSVVVAAPSRSVVAYGTKTRQECRTKKHYRIRSKVNGDEERPRLNVFRSNQHIYCQVIDDVEGHTLASASTQSKIVKEKLGEGSAATVAAAALVGAAVAEACSAKGITKVKFDRGGYKYHGRVKAIADAAREGGLDF